MNGALTTLMPKTLDEAIRFAELVAKSSIVPKDYQGNPGNVLVAVQWGAELGLGPMQAMQSIAVINGRPAVFGDALLAIVRGSGLLELIEEEVSDDGTIAYCTVQRKGEKPVTRTFSIEDAKRAGLLGKAGPWQQYTRRMLQMRARAWALRDVFADVLRGIQMAEEVRDIPQEREMGAAEVVTSRKDAVQALLARSETADSRPQALAQQAQEQQSNGDQPEQVEADPVSLDEVLAAIQSATSMSELAAVANMAAKLASEEDRQKAREAYRARREEIKTGDWLNEFFGKEEGGEDEN